MLGIPGFRNKILRVAVNANRVCVVNAGDFVRAGGLKTIICHEMQGCDLTACAFSLTGVVQATVFDEMLWFVVATGSLLLCLLCRQLRFYKMQGSVVGD